MNVIFWVGGFLSFLVLHGYSAAMDCRLSESYYLQAKSAAEIEQTIEWLKRSIDLCPNFNAWYTLGMRYKKQGRNDEALDAFIQARKNAESPKAEALALARKGEMLAHSRQLFQALRALKLAKRFHPHPAPDWLEESLKTIRIQSYRAVMPAEEIASYLETGPQTSNDKRFVIRPGVNIPVQFEFDRSELNSRGIRQVAELGAALTREKMRPWFFLLVGHTDKRGSVAYNQVLSEKRAESVKIELVRRFPSLTHRLTTEGRGETELLYHGDRESDHLLNRRVKVTLIRFTNDE